jgi:predicted nucleic acid-binding protein
MNFWDSSAIVSLFVQQAHTGRAQKWFEQESLPFVWYFSLSECQSAIRRLERTQILTPKEAVRTIERLREFFAIASQITDFEAVRRLAERILATHALSAADSLQLAAALVLAQGQPENVRFLAFDEKLQIAAAREGFAAIGED